MDGSYSLLLHMLLNIKDTDLNFEILRDKIKIIQNFKGVNYISFFSIILGSAL